MWKCRYIKLYLKLQAHPCLGKITSSQKNTKNTSTIYQTSTKNLPSRPSWRALGGSWEPLGGLLGGSWGALGAILAHLGSKTLKKSPPAKLGHEFWRGLGPQNPSKSNIIQHKINQTINHFLKWFFDRFFIDFRWILGPNMGPTSTKNPSTNK